MPHKPTSEAVHVPDFPSAERRTGEAVPLPTLQEIARQHAHRLWGPQLAQGPPIPLADAAGEVAVYAFPFLRNGASGVFPSREELFGQLADLRAQNRGSGSSPAQTRPFYDAVEETIGRFGSVYVSATRARFPVIRASHFLHPYYLKAPGAELVAARALKADRPTLRRLYFLGPHREYFEFCGREGSVLVDVGQFRLHKREAVLDEIKDMPAHESMSHLIAESWKRAEDLAAGRLLESESSTQEVLVPHHELIPVVDWTYWCAPTALTMVCGYWDYLVRQSGGVHSFGRLIDYWLKLPQGGGTLGHNVPNLLHKLIDPATGSWHGGSIPHILKETTGYTFDYRSVTGSASNDWAWGALKAEIDAGRPVHWEIFENGGHAMAAFGYRITPDRFVIVYNTWGETATQQRDEWHYALYGSSPATRSGVNALVPVDVGSAGQISLVHPVGDETTYASLPEQIVWDDLGDTIAKVDILLSQNDGNTWASLAQGVVSHAGRNVFVWTPAGTTAGARIALRAYDANGVYLAGDGSRASFSVVGGALRQARGEVVRLELKDPVPGGSEPLYGEALITLSSSPTKSLHVRLPAGPLAPSRQKMLSIFEQALEDGEAVSVDFLDVAPTDGAVARVCLERS